MRCTAPAATLCQPAEEQWQGWGLETRDRGDGECGGEQGVGEGDKRSERRAEDVGPSCAARTASFRTGRYEERNASRAGSMHFLNLQGISWRAAQMRWPRYAGEPTDSHRDGRFKPGETQEITHGTGAIGPPMT